MKTPLYILLFKVFHAQRIKNRANMSEYNLAPGQPKVLRYIASHNECKLKDIAKECDVEPATVSKILNSLEEKGMITRQINPQNKRAYQLSLTSTGQKSLEKWTKHCLEVEKISLNGFSEQEKDQFRDYLSRMYANLTGKELR
ncbi:MAG: MarR family winged helix-turn-helix transcriptional regulator [Longibaculum sp.]